MLKAQNAFQINVLNGNAIMNVKLNSKPMEVEMFIQRASEASEADSQSCSIGDLHDDIT